jgi:class 3 adenylate cyclase
LAVSVLTAFAALYTAIYFLAAPALGPHYDYLLKLRSRPGRIAKPAPGILLIETGGEGALAASTVFLLVMTLAEMGATSLLIEAPMLGVSGVRALGGPETIYRFDEEFNIIESNIKNLFDGIKLGAIAPSDAARYVNDVIKLTEQGKVRLLSAVMQGGERQAEQLENAMAVFGSVYIPDDLLVDVIRPENTAPPTLDRPSFPVYSRPPPDKDGKIRRIPVILGTVKGGEYEYAAYRAIKKYAGAEITSAGGRFTLALKNRTAANDSVPQTFVLDGNSALLFGIPAGGMDAFRKIPLALFLEYAETDRMLYRLLAESPELAQYADVSPENYPPFLYEQAALERDTLLENPETELLERWKRLRALYYDSLDRFFDKKDGSDGKIISAFDSLSEQENLDDSGEERLAELRKTQLAMYYTARDLYTALSGLHGELSGALNASFCILGPASAGTELSAMFANSILTGNYTEPAGVGRILAVSVAAVLVFLFPVSGMGTLLSLCFAVLAPAACVAGFSYSFIASGLWIDPFIPASAVASGAAASFLYSLITEKRKAARLRRLCGQSVPKTYLAKAIRSGAVNPEEETVAKAAIATVRCPELSMTENSAGLKESAAALRRFRNEACAAFLKAGAVIVSGDGDAVSAAFGSPFEDIADGKSKKRAVKKSERDLVGRAVRAVNVLLKTASDAGKLYAGIDLGECLFVSAPVTGYTASGGAVFRARRLSTLAYHCKTDALISMAASEYADRSLLADAPPLPPPDAETAENESFYRLAFVMAP